MEKKADDVYIVAAAYLSGQGKTQEEIAIDLGISQALVSRLIRRAKEKQYLETRFVSEKVSDEDLAARVIELREEGRLSIIHEDDESQEPRIICSLGLAKP